MLSKLVSKIPAVVLAATFAFAFSGCWEKDNAESKMDAAAEHMEEATEQMQEATEDAAEAVEQGAEEAMPEGH